MAAACLPSLSRSRRVPCNLQSRPWPAAPVIVRRERGRTRRHGLERIGGESLPFAFVTLQRLKALKGAVPETLTLRLPGGGIEDVAWWVPGTPSFSPGQEVVLMLAAHPAHPGQFRLTESGCRASISSRRRRAQVRRPRGIPNDDDLAVSERTPASGGPLARDAGSFLALVRAVGRGERAPEIAYARPSAPVATAAEACAPSRRTSAGASRTIARAGPVSFAGSGHRRFARRRPQGLGNADDLANDEPKCVVDAVCDVQNAGAASHGSAGPTCRSSGPADTGDITVTLDSTRSQDDGNAWSTPVGCEGGVIGLEGPGDGFGPHDYRASRATSRPRPGPFRCAR